MKNKCNKYEELFVSDDTEALIKHIETCHDCKKEYENMQKVSGLIKEVSFVYKNKKKKPMRAVFTMAASFFMVFLAFFAIQLSTPESFVNETIASISGEEFTYEQMGLPVDEYGLIMVDYGE